MPFGRIGDFSRNASPTLCVIKNHLRPETGWEILSGSAPSRRPTRRQSQHRDRSRPLLSNQNRNEATRRRSPRLTSRARTGLIFDVGQNQMKPLLGFMIGGVVGFGIAFALFQSSE